MVRPDHVYNKHLLALLDLITSNVFNQLIIRKMFFFLLNRRESKNKIFMHANVLFCFLEYVGTSDLNTMQFWSKFLFGPLEE